MSKSLELKRTSLTDLAHNLALFSLGGQVSVPLPLLAARAIADGVDLPGIAELAVASNTCERVDLETAAAPILSSFGLSERPLTASHSAFRLTASGVAVGSLDLLEGYRAIAVASVRQGAADPNLGVFSVLLEELEQPGNDRRAVLSHMHLVALEYGQLGVITPVQIGDKLNSIARIPFIGGLFK